MNSFIIVLLGFLKTISIFLVYGSITILVIALIQLISYQVFNFNLLKVIYKKLFEEVN